MKQQKKSQKIIRALLFAVICIISIAIMMFVLWVNIKNKLK